VRVDRARFLSAHIALQRRMIKIILRSLDDAGDAADSGTVERMRLAAATERPTTAEIRAARGVVFRRVYGMLEWTADRGAMPAPYAERVDVSAPGRLALPAVGGELEWRLLDAADWSREELRDPFRAAFDAALCGSVWTVRSRRPGDRLKPFGMEGTKSVQDLFVDAKLPRALRAVWPIVAGADGEVLWVPGFRRSAAAPVTERTRTVLAARLHVDENVIAAAGRSWIG